MKHQYKVLIGKPETKGPLGLLYIDGSAVLRADFKGEKCELQALSQNKEQRWAILNMVMAH
jgi:hypothetical protein